MANVTTKWLVDSYRFSVSDSRQISNWSAIKTRSFYWIGRQKHQMTQRYPQALTTSWPFHPCRSQKKNENDGFSLEVQPPFSIAWFPKHRYCSSRGLYIIIQKEPPFLKMVVDFQASDQWNPERFKCNLLNTCRICMFWDVFWHVFAPVSVDVWLMLNMCVWHRSLVCSVSSRPTKNQITRCSSLSRVLSQSSLSTVPDTPNLIMIT